MAAETGFVMATSDSVVNQKTSVDVLRSNILFQLRKIEDNLRQLKNSGFGKYCSERKKLIREKRALEDQLRQQNIHNANKQFRQTPYFV